MRRGSGWACLKIRSALTPLPDKKKLVSLDCMFWSRGTRFWKYAKSFDKGRVIWKLMHQKWFPPCFLIWSWYTPCCEKKNKSFFLKCVTEECIWKKKKKKTSPGKKQNAHFKISHNSKDMGQNFSILLAVYTQLFFKMVAIVRQKCPTLKSISGTKRETSELANILKFPATIIGLMNALTSRAFPRDAPKEVTQLARQEWLQR